MSQYASQTSVSTENSRAEIERTLRRYKADAFGYAQDAKGAMIFFRMADRHIRFVLPLPDPAAEEFNIYMRGSVKYQRAAHEAETKWEQACRQRWRALCLVIKAKLEAVSAGITTVEDEFMAHTVLPDGRTAGEWLKPQIALAYETGGMPEALMLEGPCA